MNVLTTVLYWLSTGMLIPVIVLLLLSFVWALALAGNLYGHYAHRHRNRARMQKLLQRVRQDRAGVSRLDDLVEGKSRLMDHLKQLIEVDWHPVHGEKIISDFELESKRDIEIPTTLMRVGPMLGLMGTLIPMGPALVGLAAGDITSMAANMQVAFSTTVVGIFVGAIGFIVQLVKQRWYHGDREILVYLFSLSREGEES